jgi:DNA-binding MarR family transcriptional regulator
MPRTTSLGYQINHLARLMETALRVRIASCGVAPGQFAQLLALFERDGVSQAELCKAVHVDQSTMALTLRRMERDGLVTRLPSPQDRRRTDIWLTDRARDLEATLVTRARETNTVATEGISEADLAVTHRVLARMIQNLTTQDERTTP